MATIEDDLGYFYTAFQAIFSNQEIVEALKEHNCDSSLSFFSQLEELRSDSSFRDDIARKIKNIFVQKGVKALNLSDSFRMIFLRIIIEEQKENKNALTSLYNIAGHEDLICDCSLEQEIPLSQIFMLTLRVESTEDIRYNIDNMIKKEMESVIKICPKNPNCDKKTTRRKFLLTKFPQILFISILWFVGSDKIVKKFISQLGFKLNSIGDDNKPYELSAIAFTKKKNSLFTLYSDNGWKNNSKKIANNLQDLSSLIESNEFPEVLIYKQVSPNWLCDCNNYHPSVQDLCNICFFINPNKNGWICMQCKELRPNTSTQCIYCNTHRFKITCKTCVKCGAFYDKSNDICTNCSENEKVLEGNDLIGKSMQNEKKKNEDNLSCFLCKRFSIYKICSNHNLCVLCYENSDTEICYKCLDLSNNFKT
ncbi:hypothetical protein SteCoe_14853 [Stentor coeruleus]|uniref:Uncharacterized protein n=1 Tax=Stentor coeruleus TaxID=5963 RepID=A0A1R2C544_9CILI|nr:hypothetical protein SteCoe_14853 [Stentor coeruleus]